MDAAPRKASKIWEWPLQHEDGFVNVRNDATTFEADLEVPTFRANEIDVKVMKDQLVVRCYQDRGAGQTPREINRTYTLPPDVDVKTLKSSMKNDSVLRIVASKKRRWGLGATATATLR